MWVISSFSLCLKMSSFIFSIQNLVSWCGGYENMPLQCLAPRNISDRWPQPAVFWIYQAAVQTESFTKAAGSSQWLNRHGYWGRSISTGRAFPLMGILGRRLPRQSDNPSWTALQSQSVWNKLPSPGLGTAVSEGSSSSSPFPLTDQSWSVSLPDQSCVASPILASGSEGLD